MRSELVTSVTFSDSEKNKKELLFYERKMEILASIEEMDLGD